MANNSAAPWTFDTRDPRLDLSNQGPIAPVVLRQRIRARRRRSSPCHPTASDSWTYFASSVRNAPSEARFLKSTRWARKHGLGGRLGTHALRPTRSRTRRRRRLLGDDGSGYCGDGPYCWNSGIACGGYPGWFGGGVGIYRGPHLVLAAGFTGAGIGSVHSEHVTNLLVCLRA
jgi:hypothetical protein